MANSDANPFNITKAVDLSDQQINDYWIDIPESGGFQQLMKPTSPMPMFILGGKGSGKTHLMRYFSYPLQKIRCGGDAAKLKDDGYLGIYLRCGGLNSGRFKDKRQSEEAWETVFAYYMDLWLAQLVVGTAIDAYGESEEFAARRSDLCGDILGLFSSWGREIPASLQELLAALRSMQKDVDVAVNNCAISGELKLTICATRGHLVFGIPRVLAANLSALRDCVFVYLVDEFENLSEHQQKYINTLIREKEMPCSFKVGGRMYGIRTHRTYSADEENKEGSEFETIRLDSLLRASSKYNLFAKRLIVRRLSEHGFITGDTKAQEAMAKSIGDWFETFPQEPFAQAEVELAVRKYGDGERPYFRSLRRNLEMGMELVGGAPGVSSASDMDAVIEFLTCRPYPLLEKVNVFLLYKEWSNRKPLPEAAAGIARDCEQYQRGEVARRSRYSRALEHFKVDLVAQLLRECDQKQRYLGIDTFIDMSLGVPRNLLILLKSIYGWSVYNGDTPFLGQEPPISIQAQQAGVADAADWFLGDARMLGPNGRLLEASIKRLGTLFRTVRFSDKPSECSCTSFSCDVSRVSDETRRMLDIAQKWSLLIAVSDRRVWGSDRIDDQFQLNPMLAPRWDLAVYRRGVLGLTPEECDAIFDEAKQDEFDRAIKTRDARMNAPSFAARPKGEQGAGLFAGFEK